jgi:hypothetical protein
MTETSEPVELDIYGNQEKTAANKKKYWSYDTNMGKINVFDPLISETLNTQCVGKRVKVDLSQKGQYHNIEAVYAVVGSAKQDKDTGIDRNARLRRVTDCVLASNQAFVSGKIQKDEIALFAKGLHSLIEDIDDNKL